MGLDKKSIVSKLDEVIDFSGIESFIDNPVKTYSSGMFVRLGFSIAVNAEPEILLVDEVLAVGDENFQGQCLNKIREIQKNGTSIILVTHSMELAAAFTDEAILLEKGQLVFQGNSLEVGDSYHSLQARKSKNEEFNNLGKIEILSHSLLAPQEFPIQFQPGDEFELEVALNALEPTAKWMFALEIWTTTGYLVFHGSSELSGILMPEFSGKKVIRVKVGPLNLGHGSYRVALGVAEREHVPAWHGVANAISFDLVSPEKRSGPLLLDLDFEY